MWSLENHCLERGRTYTNKPAVLRNYSNSPIRTPKAPAHTPHGFIVADTPGVRGGDSYFPASAYLAADTEGAVRSTESDSESTAIDSTVKGTSSTSDIPGDALELWTAFEARMLSDDASPRSSATISASPPEDATKPRGEDYSHIKSQHAVPEAPDHNIDEPSISDISSESAQMLKSTSSRSVTSPSTTISAPHPINSIPAAAPSATIIDPRKSMYQNAKTSSVQFLSALLSSPKIDIVDGATGEPYISGVSLRMLEHFCSTETITHLLFASPNSHQISAPPSLASKDGILRVIRYMRRWCTNSSLRPTGELHTPPSIKEGIATALACRFFTLDVDAARIENLVVFEYMASPRFFVTDEDVELICCHYGGTLRDTVFGDAVVWFVLAEVASGTHALADEVRWIVEQEEYGDLKERVRGEMRRREWRGSGRSEFLERCAREREGRVGGGEDDGGDGDRGRSANEKPLLILPRHI